MTKNNNFTLYDNAKISGIQGGDSWKVELEDEECTILIKKEVVDKINSKTSVERALIPLILAYINYTRITVNPEYSDCPDEIKEDVLINSTSKILSTSYPIERIIELARSLKWHEIEQLFNSKKPEEEIGEFI